MSKDLIPLKPSARNYRPTATGLPPKVDVSGLILAENDSPGATRFTLQQRDRLFIPFGDYPHPKGLQRFSRESAELLAQTLKSASVQQGRIYSAAAPVYRGHPDVPGRPDSDPSAPALGWVQGIEITNDGAHFCVKWNTEGEAAIAGAQYRYYSPNWLLRPVKGGIQPVKLLSIGLTNNPRIPVPAIANDDHLEKDAGEMRKEIVANIQRQMGCNYETAWTRATHENPVLFGSLAGIYQEARRRRTAANTASEEKSRSIRALIASIQAEMRCNYEAAFTIAKNRKPALFS